MNRRKEYLITLVIIYLKGLLTVLGEETLPRCKFQEYRCSDGSSCLATEKLCNGVIDCPSGEDESYDCSKIHLNKDCGDQHKFFKCRFGGCLPRLSVCNGIVECDGGSDEALDLCGNSGLKPAPNQIPPGQGVKPSKPMRPRPTPAAPNHASRPRPTRPTSTTEPMRPRPPPNPETMRPRPKHPQQSNEVDNEDQSPAAPQPPIMSKIPTCSAVEEEEGVKRKCQFRNKEVDCSAPMMNGTIATYECKSHYSVTQNAPRITRRMCKVGSWTPRNKKWNCVAECGKGGRNSAQFIVGGYTSEIGKWPWHVGFYHQDPPNSGKWAYYCGGTLISSRSVLTAAHCVSNRDGQVKKDIKLFFGKYYRNVSKNDAFIQERRPIDVKVNQYYNSQTFASDIAVVIVEPLEITDRVQLACLPNTGDSELEPGDIGTLVGWGRYHDNRYPDELQEANLPIISFKQCQKAHPSLEVLVKADSFCAGYRNGTSPCDGDSGGGLVFMDTSNKWTIYGVVSAGVAKRGGGCDPKYYTVFTRVLKFRDFIDLTLDQTGRRKRNSEINDNGGG